jgi:NAD(P)-dependent dehydrogenase (short-subunit alcohol dehydrogenase family)
MANEMLDKTVLVTGANAGIGKAACVALAKMGAQVVMVARDATKGEAALAEVKTASGSSLVHLLLADLSSQQETRKLAAEFKRKYSRLDVLLNNAGAIYGERRVTVDGLEAQFGLNHLGYFLLTNMLLDVLAASAEAGAPARVVVVSSAAHIGGKINFDDLQSEKRYSSFGAYSQSKLANLLFTYELARRLERSGTNITVNALHPGGVRTNFGKEGDTRGLLRFVFDLFLRVGGISAEEGADTAVYLASSPEVTGVTGKYFEKRKAISSSRQSYDVDVARRLWEVSERLTGLSAG